MEIRPVRRALTSLALCAAFCLGAAAQEAAPPPAGKVDPGVLDAVSAGRAEFLVVLAAQADLSEASAIRGKEAKGRFVVERLRETARQTQGPLLKELASLGAETRPFWIVNMIWVRGGDAAVRAMALRPDVVRVAANPVVHSELPGPEAPLPGPLAVEWNVSKINAPYAWSLGYTGQGVVVGGQDTGYQWDHPALKGHYRGWNGVSADHNHQWHDAIHSGGGSCGADSPFPCDDYGHGTHTMGTMTGDDGGSNQIGVAPGALWIGCRNMNVGDGTPASYAECFQWFLEPTDLSGGDPDSSLAPDVINNSWSCPPSEGCTDPEVLRLAVENTRAAGIVVVVSAGNSGSGCSSISDPAAIYEASFTVGNVDSSDVISGSSSRGPVTVDGSGRLKPDVSAPGTSIRSCVPGGGYGYKSGTSMAGPHVAGVVALLLSARSDLRGDVDAIEQLIASTALPLTTSQTCGGVPGSQVPNNTYGYGRVDVQRLLTMDSDGDGADNLTDCAPTDGSAWAASTEARDLRLSGGSSPTLTWSPPSTPGATTAVYDVLRGPSPSDFSAAACVASGITATTVSDPDAPGSVVYYLVRARNRCGGALGFTSAGDPRTGPACP